MQISNELVALKRGILTEFGSFCCINIKEIPDLVIE